MTLKADDGPAVTKGWEAPLGSSAGTSSATGAPNPYVSGQSDNPDAGPNVYYAGSLLKDAYYRFKEGGGSLLATGYPNQALGFVNNQQLTMAFVPSAIATANIAALQAPTLNTPLTLVAVAGAGITLTAAAITVLNSSQVVPKGVLQIDAAPAWEGFGTSGAIQAWNGAAAGRCVSLTSVSNLSAINFTIRGYDIYGNPQTQTMAGPNNNTVNSLKAWKWITSVTPSGTNAGTLSVGTADIFEFPLRELFFHDVLIYWNEALITANTGIVAADVTNPATALTGSTRGTYAVQSASDGTKELVVYQRLGVGSLKTSPPSLGMFGVTPF